MGEKHDRGWGKEILLNEALATDYVQKDARRLEFGC